MAKPKQNKSSESNNVSQKKEEQASRKKPKRDMRPRQDEHVEQIPFRLREIMKSKEMMQLGASKVKKMKKASMAKLRKGPAPAKGGIPVPLFRRGKRETEKAYLQRMHQETEHVLFLTQNQEERQPELEVETEQKAMGKCKSERRKEYDRGRLQRLHKKKEDKRDERQEKALLTDEVGFGEVAMAPPSFSVIPKKAPVKAKGESKELLLNSLLGHTALSAAKPSMARQRMMEEERVRVVEAYRHLKKQRQEQRQEQRQAKAAPAGQTREPR